MNGKRFSGMLGQSHHLNRNSLFRRSLGKNPLGGLLIAVFCVFAILTDVPNLYAHQGATGIVKHRMDAFTKAKSQMREIQAALRESDRETISAITSEMQIWAQQMQEAFPEGSDIPPSEALPAIWDDASGFADAITAYQTALIALHSAAQTDDSAAVRERFKAVGQACASCHKGYRK